MKKIILPWLLIIISVLLGSCTVNTQTAEINQSDNPNKTAEFNTKTLTSYLNTKGFDLTIIHEKKGEFLSVNPSIIKIGKENISIYEYKNNWLMEKEASKIKGDGSQIGNAIVDWIAPPRFYKKDKIITIYVGSNMEIINALNQFFSNSFAGVKLLSNEEILKVAYDSVPKASKDTIINWNKGNVEKYYTNEDHMVVNMHDGNKVNIKAINTYKVNFDNSNNDILGPIIIYIEQSSNRVLGTDLRD
ncbi:MAG: putative cell wall binding repeat protein [Clostridiaceae bacterium]|nr:putative cell wall binding repeat protein [Clostridiaceae bacterium]